MTNYSFVRSSENRKTGCMPVVYVSSNTCPESCPLRGAGCYAEAGRTKLHWARVDAGHDMLDVDQLGHLISALPRQKLWRYGVVGDLPGTGDILDGQALDVIVQANKGRRGFAYSHKPVGLFSLEAIANARIIERANADGFTINLSADDVAEADELADLGIGPVVVVLPTNAPDSPSRTPKGRLITVCPAERHPGAVTCERCGICANKDRKNIVGFRAHGTKRNTINRRLGVEPVKRKRRLQVIQEVAA
jgi:hypothetical protein